MNKKTYIMENIGVLHQHCGDKRKQDWQENNKGLDIQIGQHCKLAFGENDNVEHMWVLVNEADNTKRTYKGVVDNDPLYTHIHGVKFKDSIEFKFKDIEALYSE